MYVEAYLPANIAKVCNNAKDESLGKKLTEISFDRKPKTPKSNLNIRKG